MFKFLKGKRGEKNPKQERGISRAQSLRGDVSGKNRPFRPPWALPEFEFTEACTRCGACIQQCEEKILVEGRGKFPIVDFRLGECTFCEACVSACEPKVLRLDPENPPGTPWHLEVRVDHNCIAQKGVVCQVCGDQCLERVFRFRPRIGGALQMEMALEKCTGCGACIAPCPVSALTIQHRQIVGSEEASESK